MKTKIIISTIILLSFANTTFAKDILIKVTPEKTISTSKKFSLQEGDYVNFKVIEDTSLLKKGELVTGLVTSIEDNGFSGKEAQVLIENFKYNNKPLKGEIYLHGSVHKKMNEFVDRTFNDLAVFMFIRGGEVIAKPDEQYFILYAEGK